jgi:NADH-quinone oxidoreductase subunit J
MMCWLLAQATEPAPLEWMARYWSAWLVPALGFIAIFYLVPRVRGSDPVRGALVGVVALVAAGFLLIRPDGPVPETILFYAFSALAITGGCMMLSQRNPVHAALSFALVVLSTCGLFLLLAAPFLMAATIIVYAGAIVVTFLFVIMLAQQAGLSSADQRSREPFLACLGGFILLAALLCVLEKNYDLAPLDHLLNRIERVARAKTPAEIKTILGDPEKLPPREKTLAILQEVQALMPLKETPDDLLKAEEYWNRMDVPKLNAFFQKLLDHGRELRAGYGGLEPDPGLPLAPYSQSRAASPAWAAAQAVGLGANPAAPAPLIAVTAVASGNTGRARKLPARNVAALGRMLFTEYLLPVELAGVLLLVASIGAIAIAGRRSEGLR